MTTITCCFVEIVTTSQSINELNYFPNCDTLQARQPFGNYSVLLYLYFTVIIFLIRLLCVTYRFRTTLTKNKQQFETHGFGCVSQQNINILIEVLNCTYIPCFSAVDDLSMFGQTAVANTYCVAIKSLEPKSQICLIKHS